MRKVLLLLFLFLATLSLSSCTSLDTGTLIKIASPSNGNVPLYGEWEVYSFKLGSPNIVPSEQASSWIGKKAVFAENAAVIGEEYCTEPMYKIKNVNLVSYLLYQYKINPDYLNIQDEDIQAVSITSEGQYFHEFIKLGDSKIIVNIDGVFFFLKKTSDKVDGDLISKYINNNLQGYAPYDQSSDAPMYSGVLIGLRSSKKPDSKSPYGENNYRTLWISNMNEQIRPVYSTQDLFVPRKSGFWKVGVTRENQNETIRDVLFANPADKAELNTSNWQGINNENMLRTILYAGNDYISTELTPVRKDNKPNSLEVLPIDNIEGASPIKISDIAGENGKAALNEGASWLIKEGLPGSNGNFSITPDEESFYISRRNGHWIMKGRINTPNQTTPWEDFNIKIIPPSKLVSYDELCLSWNFIKARVPDAVDAYTSPNRDMAVIVTGSTLFIYAIQNGTLSQNPDNKIRLKDKENIVMAEWCSGKYVDKWDKEFMKNTTHIENTP
jgi:hypothetical protein